MRVFLDVETTAITNLLPDRIFLIVCKDDKQITYFKCYSNELKSTVGPENE